MNEAGFTKQRICHLLEKRIGKSNSITAKDIAIILSVYDIKIAEVSIRKIITGLIEEDRMMIASCNHGFFIPKTKSEVINYAESLRGRIIEIYKRLKSIKDMLPGDYFNEIQLDLFKSWEI